MYRPIPAAACALVLAALLLATPLTAQDDSTSDGRPIVPIDLTLEDRAAYLGSWRSDFGQIIRIGMKDEVLYFVQEGGMAPLVATARDVLVLPRNGAVLRASDYRNGRFHSMKIERGERAFSAERVGYVVSAAGFPGLAGRYQELDGGPAVRIVDRDGALYLESDAEAADPLVYRGDNRFRVGEQTLVHLEKSGDAGRITLSSSEGTARTLVRVGGTS